MKRGLLIFLITVLSVLWGCERRPLEYGTTNINLHLKIQLNVMVNGQMETLPEPEMMRVMFFDPDTYELYTESYLPAGGGHISIPPGRYRFLAYNFDTEATLLRNDRNYNSIEAYTNEISSALKSNLLNALQYGKSATKNEGDAWDMALEKMVNHPIIYEPDHLFVSRNFVEIRNEEGTQVIEAEAETIVETWKISVRIKNGEYMASARALISGQIASNFIGLPKEEGKTDTDATLLFDMKAGTDDDHNEIVVGQFNTFGKNPSAESRLWLTIIIKNTTGETVEWHRDITDEFMTEEASTEQIITIEEEVDIPPPDPGGGGGGFQPGVGDWESEEIPIDI